MFLKSMLSALAALFLIPSASAQARDADPALWVVKDDDTTLYLFGTAHMLKPGLGWFDEAVRTAFDASDEIVFEMLEPSAEEVQAAVLRNALSGDGKPLSAKLSEAARADYARIMTGFGKPVNALDGFQPWFAALMLSGWELPKLGYDPALGAEHVLGVAARAGGKRTIGLETPDEQFSIFKSAPEAAQIANLQTVIDELDRTGPLVEKIIDLWSKGEADRLADTMNAELRRTPLLARRLLADRNARWADWIAARMGQPGTVFVAVGAGHLGGAGSVRDLLARRGLKVERIAY